MKQLRHIHSKQQENNIWLPSQPYLDQSRLLHFMRKYNITSYNDLLLLSLHKPEHYWHLIPEFLEFEWYQPYNKVLITQGVLQTWYTGGKINSAHNMLDRFIVPLSGNAANLTSLRDASSRIAITYENGEKQVFQYTYQHLYQLLNQSANALKALGIQAGDVVCLFLPLLPEAIILLLACSKVGAICVPIAPHSHHPALAKDLILTSAKVLITVDGYFRGNTFVPTKSIADRASIDPE
jgi:acetyl-CoA synthetase